MEKKIKTKFDKIYFYASYSPKPKKPTKRQKEYLINEFLFYKNVKKLKKLSFFKGKRSKTSGKEKGVDIALCADLLTLGYKNKYDKAFIFTGDADYLYALKLIKHQKQIEVICLENRIAYPMAYFFKTVILLLTKKKLAMRNKKMKLSFIKINPMCSDIG